MKATLATIVTAVIIGGGGTFLWLYYGGFEGEQAKAIHFIDVYGDYLEIVSEVETLVHIPGSEKNSYRSELLSLLNSILTKKMNPEQRDELARLAFSNLDTISQEVNSAQTAQTALYVALQELDDTARSFVSVDLRKKATNIVSVTRKRAEITARITTILSEINEHTYAIITRILSEQGELTDAHIIEINNATGIAEERFEMLGALYVDLEERKGETETLFVVFVESAI